MNQKVYWNMKQDVQYALDNDELFLRNGWPTKGVKPYFQLGPLSKIFTIANEWSSTIVITFTPRRHYIPGGLIIPN